jgi:hypothetical protein
MHADVVLLATTFPTEDCNGRAVLLSAQTGPPSLTSGSSAVEVREEDSLVYREAKTSTVLKNVLDRAIKTDKFSTPQPLNSLIFPILFQELGSEHTCLLLHAHHHGGCRLEKHESLYKHRDNFITATSTPCPTFSKHSQAFSTSNCMT